MCLGIVNVLVTLFVLASKIYYGWTSELTSRVHNIEAYFLPLEDLSTLPTSEFTTLGHYLFPKYGIRIKRSTDFCDETVNSYTGYIDVEARHIFFYFFESRNDPAKDDVIFWTNGGPGCSSSVALFMELGPCRVASSISTTFNPHSWSTNANIFFIDQPIGVGFSYADHDEYVSSTEEAAEDISAFVAIFFEHFTQFKGRAFHMAGESYGGKYIPVFAAHVYDQNAKLLKAGMVPVNLSSILIGNGCTDDTSMMSAYVDMQCSAIPTQSISTCVQMRQALPRCERWLREACVEVFDQVTCRAAESFCERAVFDPLYSSGHNPFDLTQHCDDDSEDTSCYPIRKDISQYLSRPDLRKKLGVDPSLPVNFSSCSAVVSKRFEQSVDTMLPYHYYIAALLDRGIKTLLYAGANDGVCNWIGNERMSRELEWSGQASFVSQPLREWQINGTTVGLTRSWGRFTFATVYGAGHMVPYDQPEVSLEMLQRWLADTEL